MPEEMKGKDWVNNKHLITSFIETVERLPFQHIHFLNSQGSSFSLLRNVINYNVFRQLTCHMSCFTVIKLNINVYNLNVGMAILRPAQS